MKIKYFSPILIIFLSFIYISPLFSQTAKILSGNFEYSQYSSNVGEQDINFKVEVKNTGSTPLVGLWLEVGIESEGGSNIGYIRKGKWIYLPKLNPNQSYDTGYKLLFTFNSVARAQGINLAFVKLRDSNRVYDYEQTDSFVVN